MTGLIILVTDVLIFFQHIEFRATVVICDAGLSNFNKHVNTPKQMYIFMAVKL